jgi:hypothetical protein
MVFRILSSLRQGSVNTVCHKQLSFKSLFPRKVRTDKFGGEKEKRGKGERGGIGKEIDRLAGIIKHEYKNGMSWDYVAASATTVKTVFWLLCPALI